MASAPPMSMASMRFQPRKIDKTAVTSVIKQYRQTKRQSQLSRPHAEIIKQLKIIGSRAKISPLITANSKSKLKAKASSREIFKSRTVVSGDVGDAIRNGSKIIPGLVYESMTKTFYLTKSSEFEYLIADDVYITLFPDEIVDGKGHQFHMGSKGDHSSYGLFDIDDSVTDLLHAPVIKNLRVKSRVYDYGAGGLVRGGNSYFKVQNCQHQGRLDIYCGGLCGGGCSNFIIINSDVDEEAIEMGGGGICGSDCQDGTITGCTSRGLIRGAFFFEGDGAGGICGYNCSSLTITKCSSSGDIAYSSGGIVGTSCEFMTISDCFSTGDIGEMGGGITGTGCGNSVISKCYSTGRIGAQGGGICGSCVYTNETGMTIEDCYSTGRIGEGGGGIIGFSCSQDSAEVLLITRCFSTGDIGSTSGGIVGSECEGFTVVDCYSHGQVIGTAGGGICGAYCESETYPIIITGCYSIGNMESYAGGIVGAYCDTGNDVDDETQFTVSKCYSLGQIGSSAGGIIGGSMDAETADVFTVSNCYSMGRIMEYAGGICGPDANLITITGCYSTGHQLQGSNNGIMAETENDFTETNCYCRQPFGSGEYNLSLIKDTSLAMLSGSTWKATKEYPILREFRENPWSTRAYKKPSDQAKLD
jgi:hypothetical protein